MKKLNNHNMKVDLLAEKYSDLTPLARWKAVILEYGVDISSNSLFNTHPEIERYKTKFARIKPYVENFRYVDKETDTTVIPSELTMNECGNRSLVKVNYRESSPLVLCSSESGFVIKAKNGGMISPVAVELVPKNAYSEVRLPKEIDKSQHFLQDCVQIVGQDRIGILAFEGCWHWNTKRACQFCDANPKREDFDTLMPSLNKLAEFGFDEVQWWKKFGENYMRGIEYAFDYICRNEKIEPHQHLQLMAGNLPHSESLWKICRQISTRLNRIKLISSFDSYLNRLNG